MDDKYFLTQIKRNNGVYTKGVVVQDTLAMARQSYHAYLGAYGFGHEQGTDYVACYICDMRGRITDSCVDDRIEREPAQAGPEEE